MAASDHKIQIQLSLSVRSVEDKETSTAVIETAEKEVQTEDETLVCRIDNELKEARRQATGESYPFLIKSRPYGRIRPLLATPKQFTGLDGGRRVITKRIHPYGPNRF